MKAQTITKELAGVTRRQFLRVAAHLGDGHPSNLRGAPREQFIPGKLIHPHDAMFLRNGDILVAEWVPIGRITLIRRVLG